MSTTNILFLLLLNLMIMIKCTKVNSDKITKIAIIGGGFGTKMWIILFYIIIFNEI